MSASSSEYTMEDLIEAGMASDPTELQSLPLDQRSELPAKPGVYFVLGEDNEVLYIGQSTSLWRRWASSGHQKLSELQKLGNVRLAWMETESTGQLEEIERVLINHFSPKMNGSRGSRGSRGGKRSNPDYRGTTFFLQKNTLNEANIRLLGSDMDLSDLIESLLQEWVAKQKKERIHDGGTEEWITASYGTY